MVEISLNGAWRMHQAETDIWHEALVPGSVYADLLRDQTIPDPFYRDNELAAFDLLRNKYEYVRTFEVDAELLSHKHHLLRCEGLDTLAHVCINGKELGFADNMHITWEWECTEYLHEGTNEIRILFDSPIDFALENYDRSPGWCSTDAIPGYPHLRKAHCMYGWDWGPRLPDAGIWRNISLIAADDAMMESVLILQEHKDGKVSLRIRPELKFGNVMDCRYVITVFCPDGDSYAVKMTPVVVVSGMTSQIVEECAIDIPNPQLWWPNGYGEQPLYTVYVDLMINDVLQQRWKKRIGLRTMEISRKKDEWGEEFCHVVNGVKIFAMGGDYIPEDNILQRVNPQRTRRLLEDAVLANFNTVRIWGGGYYPDDFFYDICDELGLLVWQDLMYACAYYDLTPEFERSIRKETEQNLRRLRSHPSLALICGNNEMEQFQAEGIAAEFRGDFESYGPVRPSHHADYIKMFEYIMPEISSRIAPQTFYWPASPSSGGSFDNPNDPNRGDTHYWGVWHGEKPFTEYRKFFFRYASEFGFQSFPCLKTVESFTQPEDRNIFSRIMERHQRNKSANGKILSYMSQTYQYPNSFDNLLYCSQLLQAEAIRYGVEHWRRNRGRCMGAIIWQLNDCWPVASWSSIDYYGRWKALHYAAKRFFAPVMLSCCEHGELDQNPHINEFLRTPITRSIQLNVANDTMQDFEGIVTWALRNPDGTIVREGRSDVKVPALTAKWLDEEVLNDYVPDVTRYYVSYALLTPEEETISEGSVLFCAPKHFAFENPKLRVRYDHGDVVIEADAFAKNLYIESDDADLLLEDNFFDMQPGERRIRVLRGDAKSGLKVRSVYDLAR